MRKAAILLTAALAAISSTPAQAEYLKGSVETYESRVTSQLQAMQPKWDAAGLTEHCSCMNPNKVRAVELNGQWQLVDDGTPIAAFGSRQDAAEAAQKIAAFYGFTESCWAGRSDGADLHEMRYFKTRDGAPQGAMPDEDALPINAANVEAKQINGSWKVVDGDHWMLDFGVDQAAAEQACDVIRVYDFKYFCFAGKPARAMMYFRR